MSYRIVVYNWNPNGTNDIQIENSYSDFDTRCEDSLQEALFGIDVNKLKPRFDDADLQEQFGGYYLPLKTALKHIAVSPISDGRETVQFLSKYFKTVRGEK